MGADIFITDEFYAEIPLKDLTKNMVIPVIPRENNVIFIEFDPMKFEGNSFMFDSVNEFQMFAGLIRALENIRFAGDRRILLANIENI